MFLNGGVVGAQFVWEVALRAVRDIRVPGDISEASRVAYYLIGGPGKSRCDLDSWRVLKKMWHTTVIGPCGPGGWI